jgi:hypothetical protein
VKPKGRADGQPRYLDSAAGNDANNGTTWALAKATVAGIDAIDTAGDTIYVAQTHSETTAAAVSYSVRRLDREPHQDHLRQQGRAAADSTFNGGDHRDDWQHERDHGREQLTVLLLRAHVRRRADGDGDCEFHQQHCRLGHLRVVHLQAEFHGRIKPHRLWRQ